MTLFIQLCAVFVGCTAFALLYKIKPKRLIFCGMGASLTWLTYVLTNLATENVLLISIVAASFATIYAETLARITKAPATIYLIPSIFPLVPGGALYYTTSALVNGQDKQFSYYGLRTVYTSIGLAIGILFISLCVFYFKQWRLRQKALIARRQQKAQKTK